MLDHRIMFFILLGVVIAAPIAWAVVGRRQAPPPSDASGPGVAWSGRLFVLSLLLYVLAFNVTFFIQELFLVLPKAFTPGLQPVLYHNNHSWTGTNPLARLFQGTGALAIFLTGCLAAAWLRWRAPRSFAGRLFCVWMIFHGCFQALPQVVIGATSPQNDVGQAMTYLKWGVPERLVASGAALLLLVVVGTRLTRPLLELAANGALPARLRDRAKLLFNIASGPALAAIPLLLAYRVPREIGEVIGAPIAVVIVGCGWLHAHAWRVTAVTPRGQPQAGSWKLAAAACVAVLLFFQLVLRPGVRFY